MAVTKEDKPTPNSSIDELIKMVKSNEGFRDKPYKCSVNKLTIGYGRNLTDKGITQAEGEYLLMNDIMEAMKDCASLFPTLSEFSERRRNVLIDMRFQLGLQGLLGFQRMIRAINNDDWQLAGEELMDSRYAQQTKGRANRNKEALQRG